MVNADASMTPPYSAPGEHAKRAHQLLTVLFVGYMHTYHSKAKKYGVSLSRILCEEGGNERKVFTPESTNENDGLTKNVDGFGALATYIEVYTGG